MQPQWQTVCVNYPDHTLHFRKQIEIVHILGAACVFFTSHLLFCRQTALHLYLQLQAQTERLCDSPSKELKYEIIKIEGQNSGKKYHTNALQSHFTIICFSFISVGKKIATILVAQTNIVHEQYRRTPKYINRRFRCDV